MNATSYSVREIGQSFDEFASIVGESLLVSDRQQWETYADRIGRQNIRGVYEGSRLAGGMAFYRARQWFGGKPIRSAGFSAVAISPPDRGSGACGAMLRRVLEEIRADGFPLASLYASTQKLYRSVGFEHAGTQTNYSIPFLSLKAGDRSMPVQRFDSPPIDQLNQVADARAAQTNGNLGRTEGLWQRLLVPYDGRGTVTYLFGEPGSPEGFLIVKGGTRDGGVPQALVSTDVAVNTPAARERLFTLLRDHRSMCDAFEWFGPPNDPLIFAAEEQWVEVKDAMRWMLRIVDLPSALSTRGYCPSLSVKLDLEIEDDLFPENAGRWQLEISEGAASVRRGGEGNLRMNIRALAPIFSSHFSAEQLVRMGTIASSDPDQARLATQAFAGDAAWMPELF